MQYYMYMYMHVHVLGVVVRVTVTVICVEGSGWRPHGTLGWRHRSWVKRLRCKGVDGSLCMEFPTQPLDLQRAR